MKAYPLALHSSVLLHNYRNARRSGLSPHDAREHARAVWAFFILHL